MASEGGREEITFPTLKNRYLQVFSIRSDSFGLLGDQPRILALFTIEKSNKPTNFQNIFLVCKAMICFHFLFLTEHFRTYSFRMHY
jgi:hypothetical protein